MKAKLDVRMHRKLIFAMILFFITILAGCSRKGSTMSDEYNILFLHHSTGEAIWKGGSKAIEIKGIHLGGDYDVPKWFKNYNSANGTSYMIKAQNFPAAKPYGWQNYPFDYYNIWIKNAGEKAYENEPTLEMLTKKYKLIIFKHCYPVSLVSSDTINISIDSKKKTIENYKLQYLALKEKLLQFPDTKFIIWTGAVMLQNQLPQPNALVAKSFFDWVRNTWDSEGDNIFLWDFYQLETEGDLFLKPEFATALDNSHPNVAFAQKVAPLFCQRIVDVIEK